jgi:hypothetical protein
MFFQSFGFSGSSVALYVNKNALKMTYLGNAATSTGPNPFVVTPMAV